MVQVSPRHPESSSSKMQDGVTYKQAIVVMISEHFLLIDSYRSP